jgi:hypothetical protein
VSEDRYDVKPNYFLFGGLLFVPLTRDYLKTWGQHWWASAPHSLMARYESGVRTPQRREVVVLQKVLADRANHGYHDVESVEIHRVQGTAIRDLKHMVSLLNGTSEYVCFETAEGMQIVLDRKEAIERTPHILQRFGVPRDRSPDLEPETKRRTPA